MSVQETYIFGDFRFDAGERLLFRNGERLPLPEKAFAVLNLLLREHGSLVTKHRFLDEIWPNTAVEQNNLDKCISLIRRTLGESGEGRFIETVRGHGYRFVADVTKAASKQKPDEDTGLPLNSVAVLPFKNLSDDRENEYFCDGLAEELLNSLSKIKTLKVAARTSAFSFKDKDIRVREIAKTLQVKTILEGSVRRSNSHLRITVRLVDAETGYSLWSENFDRDVKDIFDIQDEIALAVVDSLKVEWFSGEREAVLKRHTAEPEAWISYMRGQYYRWKAMSPMFAHSLKHFQRAVEIDPAFAPGYFGLCTYYGYGTAWGLITIDPKRGWELTISAVNKALELDETFVEPRLALGAVKLIRDRNFELAGEMIKNVAEMIPALPEIHHLYSFYYLACGDHNAAIDEAKQALSLDPLSVLLGRFLGQCLYFSRQYESSIRQLRDTLELDTNNYLVHKLMAEVCLKIDRADEAFVHWKKAAELDPEKIPGERSNSANVDAAMKDEASRRLDWLFERAASVEYVPAIRFARQYVVLDDTEKAFEWLDKACGEQNVFPLMIKSDPFYDRLRDDPRFEPILKKAELPVA
jgi:TolB-like protein